MNESGKTNMEHFPLKERLHTDVLEDRYGPVHAEVHEHTDARRIIDIVDESSVSRTHAITLFPKWCDNELLSTINEEIKAGGLIGKSFRDHGYTIRKHVAGVYTVELPSWLQKRFDVEGREAKARTSEFYARKGKEKPLIYGFVTEIYSPDFRSAEINDTDTEQVSAATNVLESLGVSREQIWESIVGNDEIEISVLEEAQSLSAPRSMDNQKYIDYYLESSDT